MAVTRNDVARLAGVSSATVSYVINDGPRPVAEATRAKVLQVIEELGYRPNITAQNLRRQRTNTIGLVFTTIDRHLNHPYFVDLLTSIAEECAQQGFDLLLSPSGDRATDLTVYERLVGGRRVDGIIFTGVCHDDNRITYLKEREIPFVVLGRPENDDEICYVDVDGAQGTDEATQHLINQDWQRIAYIGLPTELICADERLAGYSRALARNGLVYNAPLVVNVPTITEGDGYQAMTRFLTLEDPPDAIVAGSDELALGAMDAAQKQGLVIGQDVAVIGFDDIPSAARGNPPLTTIRQPMYEIGTQLGHMLIQIIKGEALEERQVILPPTLVIRESCGALRHP